MILGISVDAMRIKTVLEEKENLRNRRNYANGLNWNKKELVEIEKRQRIELAETVYFEILLVYSHR